MSKAKQEKVPVTMRALIQRINRKLAGNGQALKSTHPGSRAYNELGDCYLFDTKQNEVVQTSVVPEKLGRKLGILKEWEKVEP
jgi:hypothetical protein